MASIVISFSDPDLDRSTDFVRLLGMDPVSAITIHILLITGMVIRISNL